DTDRSNCGACGNTCRFENAAAACNAGACAPVCAGTFANCDGIGGCETDLSSSATNCGLCGRDCKGSNCRDGAWEPIPVVVGESGTIVGMGITAADIVWTTYRTIRTVPKIGGNPTTLAADQYASHVAVDGVNAYWPDIGTIRKCAIAGCGGVP